MSQPDQPQGHFRGIDIQTYRERFHPGDHTLVDVREVEEWAVGRIPGAVHISLYDLADHLADIPADKPVVVVCASGARSLYAARLLLDAGYAEVYNLEDGMTGWTRKGLPVER